MIAYFFVTMVIYLLITLWEFKKFASSSLQFITSQPNKVFILLVFLTIVGFFYYLVIVQTYTRALWEDIYTQKAESFCVRDLIYLIYELENTDFISEDNGRELLRIRMKALNKKTRLLGSKLAREDISNREQIRSFYQNIAKEIDKRTGWLASPQAATTLQDLRSYFRYLSICYINEQYGDIELTSLSKTQMASKVNWKQKPSVIFLSLLWSIFIVFSLDSTLKDFIPHYEFVKLSFDISTIFLTILLTLINSGISPVLEKFEKIISFFKSINKEK